MARLAGVDIPREKRVEVALTYIYGVGRTRALKTLADTKISGDIRVKDLTDDQLVTLRDHIEGTYKVEGDLRREVAADIRHDHGRVLRVATKFPNLTRAHFARSGFSDYRIVTSLGIEPRMTVEAEVD